MSSQRAINLLEGRPFEVAPRVREAAVVAAVPASAASRPVVRTLAGALAEKRPEVKVVMPQLSAAALERRASYEALTLAAACGGGRPRLGQSVWARVLVRVAAAGVKGDSDLERRGE